MKGSNIIPFKNEDGTYSIKVLGLFNYNIGDSFSFVDPKGDFTNESELIIHLDAAKKFANDISVAVSEAEEKFHYDNLSDRIKYVMKTCDLKSEVAEQVVEMCEERSKKSGLAFEEEVFSVTMQDLANLK